MYIALYVLITIFIIIIPYNQYLDDLYVDLVLDTQRQMYYDLNHHCDKLMDVSSSNWRSGARRLIIMIGHGIIDCKDLESNSGKLEETAKMLKEKSVNMISCNSRFIQSNNKLIKLKN